MFIYYVFVAKEWTNAPNETMRVGLDLLTMFTIIFWSVTRLRSLQNRLVSEANAH